jgi:protein TonB
MLKLQSADLTNNEHSSLLLLEIFVLVALIHVWLLRDLLHPKNITTEAKPLVMQISLLAKTEPKSEKPVPGPAPPLPRPVEKKITKPTKVKSKPKLSKAKPDLKNPVPTPMAIPKTEPVPEKAEQPPPTQASPSAPVAPNSKTETGPASLSASKPNSTFTEANYRANYGFNPKPKYPRIARSRGWQGKVLLKVQVSASGISTHVAVHKSSGHEILDESAIDAVKQWRFIPARRGETPVASSVIVPILFSLKNN